MTLRRGSHVVLRNSRVLAVAFLLQLLSPLLALASPPRPFLDFTFSEAQSEYPQPPRDPSIRFLTYEWLDEPGGLGDYLTGLATSFACAMLTQRAFIVRHALLPLAFEPNLIDWSFSLEVPVEPARVMNIDDVMGWGEGGGPEGGGGEGGERRREGEEGGEGGGRGEGGGGGGGREEAEEVVQDGEVVEVDLKNQRFVEPEDIFAQLDKAMNVRLSWNRGLLTYWLAEEEGKKWSERLKDMGMRPPYSFGCILRFLLKPLPDILSRTEAMYHHLFSPLASSSPPSALLQAQTPHHLSAGQSGASHHSSSDRVVVVGMHMRAPDSFVWQGESGFGDPKVLSETERTELIKWAMGYVACAQRLEAWWVPPPTIVKWLIISNSQDLKAILKLIYPDKVVVSDIVPMHVNNLMLDAADPSSPPSSAKATPTKQASVNNYGRINSPGDDILEEWRAGDSDNDEGVDADGEHVEAAAHATGATGDDGAKADDEADAEARTTTVEGDVEADDEAEAEAAPDAVAPADVVAIADVDAAEGGADDDPWSIAGDDDVPLLKRRPRHRLQTKPRRACVVLSDDDSPGEELQPRISTAEKGKTKVADAPAKATIRRRPSTKKRKNDGDPGSSMGAAKKKKKGSNKDDILVNEALRSDDDYAEAAAPIPSFPEKAKPKDPTLHNPNSRPPSPCSKDSKKTPQMDRIVCQAQDNGWMDESAVQTWLTKEVLPHLNSQRGENGTTGDNTRLLGQAPEEEEEEMQAEGVREVAVATGLEVLYQETPNYRGAAAEADRMIEPRETARHAWRVPDLGVDPGVSAGEEAVTEEG
ncbi:unnamed protein product [Closterium sp. NIES-65]|nr:unnamed protein product [Closterium sp. NIES-65]